MIRLCLLFIRKKQWNYWGWRSIIGGALLLLADKAYEELAQAIKKYHEKTEIICFEDYVPEDVSEIFKVSSSTVVLLLAEPISYVKYRLFEHLDFSNGEPEIPGRVSKVLVFPKESLCRIFSESADNIATEQEKMISEMKENQKYRITSSGGTDLTFESRKWIPLDFEVCTFVCHSPGEPRAAPRMTQVGNKRI